MVKTLLPAKVTRTPFWKDTRWRTHKFNGCMRCDWSAMPCKNRLGMCSRLVGSTSTFFDTLSHKLLYLLGLNTQQSFSLTPQQSFWCRGRSRDYFSTWFILCKIDDSLLVNRGVNIKPRCTPLVLYVLFGIADSLMRWYTIYTVFYKIILPG